MPVVKHTPARGSRQQQFAVVVHGLALADTALRLGNPQNRSDRAGIPAPYDGVAIIGGRLAADFDHAGGVVAAEQQLRREFFRLGGIDLASLRQSHRRIVDQFINLRIAIVQGHRVARRKIHRRQQRDECLTSCRAVDRNGGRHGHLRR